ncbi:MAG: hypothetical protein C0459_13825 [Chitinophaga sp.]|jgi:thioredoxin-related protein|nr:hypothetical protein [Chitinophaga sp.]
MKLLLIPFLILFAANTAWLTNFNDAKKTAKEEHKFILLNFSGSDWCGPCERMKAEFFETDVFKKFAEKNLVLLNADFPRNKKNQLPAAQQKMNDALADKYNSNGAFPLTVLLDADGNVLQKWDGFPKTGVENFIEQIQQKIKN